ncbi:MAG: AAA family ATPase, partial [Planctomycetaceae bacterium]|nr:AAA family ATPase [Planctomycetaceae bacterium]
LVYRSLVRAKVCELRLQQADLTETEKLELVRALESYLDLATQYTQPRDVSLTITHGLSGSGKTYGTQQLLERTGAIRVRSDVERKRLFGIDSHQRATAAPQQGIYSPTAGQETYQQLEALAAQVVEAGFPVIVDATFLKRDQRTAFRILAERLGVPFHIQEFQALPDELRRRIVARQRMATDASDATLETLESQLQTVEPLTSQESRHVVVKGS